ncbi:MAG: DUF4957 domain-containing protein [Bacteroidales bacterium]|nr:DUF4957 domain-containing protein [Bacteroidales bacterium]
MRAIKFSLLAVAAMAAVSCAKEITPETNETPEVNPNLVEITLTATGESDEETKAVFSGYPKIAWEGNEEISLLGTNTGNQKLTANGNGHQTTFTGYADVTDEAYYAVYPYDPNVSLNANGTIANVTVPAIQTATAGSFDPEAYIAVAKSTDKESLYFKAVGAFVKFKLEDAENVKSVTMVSNSGANMACSATVVMNENGGVSHGSPYVDGTASSSVKMVGDFQTDKAYFMVVRPQPYEGGVTFYIEYKDGTVLSRTGASALFESGKARNYIRNLNTLQKKDFKPVTDLYTLYTMGYDVTVGDMTINKETHSAKLITASEANTSLYNQFNNGGIYFLAVSGEGSFNLHSNVTAKQSVVLIGNASDGKISIDVNGKNINHAAGTIALKNIELKTGSNTNYVFANNNATADVDAFILDDCVVTDLMKPLWYVNVADYTLKNLTLVNTDIALTGATNIIDLAKTTSLGNESVIIKNCILYSTSNTVSRIINNSQNLTAWTADVVFEDNTIFNLHAGSKNGLLHMAGASSVNFKNNLVNFYSLNATEYVIRIWKNTPTYTIENNHFWARATAGIPSDLTFYSNVIVEPAASAVCSGKYPFTSNVPGAGATR